VSEGNVMVKNQRFCVFRFME